MENTASRTLAEEKLAKVFGFESFRGQQAEIVEHVLEGGDALVLVPTGGGKSMCYQIPAMIRPGVGIIISPLIALMQDQVSALKENGVSAAYLNSTCDPDEAREVIEAAVEGRLDLLYVSPERLMTEGFQNLIESIKVSLFAVDEAHCVSMWGHDFRPEYVKLSYLKQCFPDVPLMALTATADEPTRKDIVDKLKLSKAKHFISSFDRPNIKYQIVPKTNGRQQLLEFIQAHHAGASGIVYCQTRNNVDKIAEWLCTKGVEALPYHAGMDREDRQENQEHFQKEDQVVMVATVAFGMGIDKSNVRFVAHLGLPKSLEAYYQETGRAGRDGLPSDAWMAFGHADVILVNKWLEASKAPKKQKRLERQKLNTLLGFCESTDCRRKVILNYFAEEHEGACGNCDNCLTPPETYDGLIDAQKALSAVYRTEQIFGAVYLVDVLIGSSNARIKNFNHHLIKTHGVGKEEGKVHWFSVYRQLIAAECLGVDHENGGLYLKPSGMSLLKAETSIQLRRDSIFVKSKKSKSVSKALTKLSSNVFDEDVDIVLFDALRQCRREIAQENDVPAYIIFSDATLVDMVLKQPQSLSAMLLVKGVGDSKLEKYGEEFLEVLKGSQ